MTTLKNFMSVATVAVTVAMSTASLAHGQSKVASFHGHVTSPAGVPQPNGEVTFTQDKTVEVPKQKILNSFPIGPDGNYSGTGVTPGDYYVYVVSGTNHIDRAEITVKAGEDRTLDFDMTRKAYLDSMSPEERKKIEDYKKSAAEAMKANAAIADLNATLLAVRADLKTPTPNLDKDVADMKAATTSKPDESVLWSTYADVLMVAADTKAAADKKAGKPYRNDDAVMKLYEDGADAYQKGIDLNAKSKKPSLSDEGISYGQEGAALAKQGKYPEAVAAYDKAAQVNPPGSSIYYKNEAAVLYNLSQVDAAANAPSLAAAEKAILADPTLADPYYIKGQILLQGATLDSKTQKLTTPDGCIDAYQHYLSLAPNGKYAADVKAVLQELGEKIDSHYRAPSKK